MTPENKAQVVAHDPLLELMGLDCLCERCVWLRKGAASAQVVAAAPSTLPSAPAAPTEDRFPSPECRPLTLEQSITSAQVCCGEYATCHRACTPRGRWQAAQAIEAIEREFVALDDLPAFIHRLQDEVRASRAALAPTGGEAEQLQTERDGANE